MIAHDAAIDIMRWLHIAEDDLIDKGVILFGGEAGTVRAVKLDEHHGLCFTFEGDSKKFYPVSTIRMKS